MDGIVLTISCEKYYVYKWLCDNNLRKLQLCVAYLATLSHYTGIHQDTANIAVPCYLQAISIARANRFWEISKYTKKFTSRCSCIIRQMSYFETRGSQNFPRALSSPRWVKGDLFWKFWNAFSNRFQDSGDRKQVENGLTSLQPDTVSRNVSTKTWNDLPKTTYNCIKPPTAN